MTIKGTHRLLLDTPQTAASSFRPQMDQAYAVPFVAYTPLSGSPASWISSHTTKWSGLANTAGLPVNVNLMTVDLLAGEWAATPCWKSPPMDCKGQHVHAQRLLTVRDGCPVQTTSCSFVWRTSSRSVRIRRCPSR